MRESRIFTVITDASYWGYGGIVYSLDATFRWYSGAWLDNKHDIQDLEIMAVRHTLTQGVPEGATVRLIVDNTSVLYAIRNRRSRRYMVNQELSRTLPKWHVQTVTYIRSEDNPADDLSRNKDNIDGQLLVKAMGLGSGELQNTPSQITNCHAITASDIHYDPRDQL